MNAQVVVIISGGTKGTKTVSTSHHLRRTWGSDAARDSRKLYLIAAFATVKSAEHNRSVVHESER